MGEEQLTSLVGSLGFPIVVAMYQMFVVNKTLNKVSETLKLLSDRIERIELKQ